MHQARCAMGIPLIWLRIMAFRLLTPSSKGSACETSANESFYGGRKRFCVEPLSFPTQQRLPLGIPIKTARKTAIKISARGKMGRGKKPGHGPVTGRFAYESFRKRPVRYCIMSFRQEAKWALLMFMLRSLKKCDTHVYYMDTSVLLENIPLVKFIKTTSGTRVVYFP